MCVASSQRGGLAIDPESLYEELATRGPLLLAHAGGGGRLEPRLSGLSDSQTDLSAARTRRGINGYRRILTPVASKNALPIAATTAGSTSSPAPLLGSSIRWTTIGVTAGCSPKRRV